MHAVMLSSTHKHDAPTNRFTQRSHNVIQNDYTDQCIRYNMTAKGKTEFPPTTPNKKRLPCS